MYRTGKGDTEYLSHGTGAGKGQTPVIPVTEITGRKSLTQCFKEIDKRTLDAFVQRRETCAAREDARLLATGDNWSDFG
jgi:hypothetical protein